MTDKTPARPELPEPELGYIETDKSRQPAFSARQMREALQSAQPAAPGVTGAMQTLIETLKADPEYAWAWHCNVAMATFDEGLSHYAANKAAARFLSWLAQIDTTTHPGFPKAPAQPAAAVSDEEIWGLWDSQERTGLVGGPCPVKFARAILALRHAQQAPEWDGGKPANLQAAARDADEWLALIQRLNDAGRLLFSQPDSRSKLDGCRAALSKILCAPAQQAVPMTCTWVEDDETGNYATTCGHVFAINDGGPADNGMKFCCYCGGGITAQGAQGGEAAK